MSNDLEVNINVDRQEFDEAIDEAVEDLREEYPNIDDSMIVKAIERLTKRMEEAGEAIESVGENLQPLPGHDQDKAEILGQVIDLDENDGELNIRYVVKRDGLNRKERRKKAAQERKENGKRRK